jgi:hypothetical protein
MVFQFAIGLHYARGHSSSYSDTGTQVLAKYQGIVWKGDPLLLELNSIPTAKFAKRAKVGGLARDHCLGDAPI